MFSHGAMRCRLSTQVAELVRSPTTDCHWPVHPTGIYSDNVDQILNSSSNSEASGIAPARIIRILQKWIGKPITPLGLDGKSIAKLSFGIALPSGHNGK